MSIIREILPVALNFEALDDQLPDRIDLLPGGERITGRDGRSWENPNPSAVAERVNGSGTDLVLDFEHASEIRAPRGDPAPAAAWLHDLRVESDGRITAAVNRWTPKGEQAVRDGEYRYISPAVLYDPKTMIIVGIGSAGLTNKPNLPMRALNHEHQEDTMIDPQKILAKLGLPDDASEEAALNAIGKLHVDLQTALNSVNTPPMDKFVPRADYELALNRATTAEARIAAATQEKLEGEITTAIDQAVAGGKIAPASKEYYTAMCRTEGGLEQFKTFIASAPKIVACSGLDGKLPGSAQTALNADQTKIMQMFGNTADDIAKFGIGD